MGRGATEHAIRTEKGVADMDAMFFSAVQLHFGDATLGRQLDFTHIFSFDRVFSPVTMRAFARILCRSPFRVFVSFRSLQEWWRWGVRCLHPVARLRMSTTGK